MRGRTRGSRRTRWLPERRGSLFYAGAPPITPDGHRLGSLCVIDTKARCRPPDELLAQLETLSSLVVDEMELRRAKKEAEEMNRLKSAFLGNMSHETPTSLTSIIGFAELVAEALDMAGEFADSIHRSGKRLLSTLNSVLDLAQLGSGSRPLTAERVDVGGGETVSDNKVCHPGLDYWRDFAPLNSGSPRSEQLWLRRF